MNVVGWKDEMLRRLTNMRGWRTRRRVLVFESDDWGATRMPSRAAFDALRRARVPVEESAYDRLDCLESRSDLEALCEVLGGHRDQRDRPAVFTLNTVMGNPDFDAIRAANFESFAHQHFRNSYLYYHGDDFFDLWRSGMQANLIRPQFHAREHLNSRLWMWDLLAGHREARLAFEHRFYGMRAATSSPWQKHYRAAYWVESDDEIRAVEGIVEEGLDSFEQTFGFRSNTFIGCNYVWPTELEPVLASRGVTLLQGQRGQRDPRPALGGRVVVRRRFTGQANRWGQRYSVRNVLFEPYVDERVDWVGRALREMAQSFLFGKPAIVSSHRVNYVGGMDIRHRDRNLRLLDALLKQVLRRWPDVEFLSSDQLAETIVGR